MCTSCVMFASQVMCTSRARMRNIAACPLGLGWQIGINAIIGAGNYSLNQVLSGSKLTHGGLIAGALTGAIMGRVGGDGWLHGSVGQLLKGDI